MAKPKRDPNKETKLCAVCETVIKRYPGISGKVWAARKCCSEKCGGIYNQKDIEDLKNPKAAISRRRHHKNEM